MTGGFELRGKHVLVIGLARTGIATARFCAEHGATVTATDTHSESELGAEALSLREEGVTLELGTHPETALPHQDLVIPSPGVPADAPLLRSARQKNITVWSEIELADRFLDGRLIGITGSNGKTTTTSLVHHILRVAGFSSMVAGNIGTPLISRVALSSADTITVAELSSFQLELIETFHADIAVLLNLTPDHLDRHKTMEAYAAAKARLFENQNKSDFEVLKADDHAATRLAPKRP
jgi:UDP-N-acetylmuramoylalanine--D-glutamate ligase